MSDPAERGMVDTHSHLLPEIDDGADSMDEALEMARLAVADGITAVIATPHVREGYWENEPDGIRGCTRRMREALEAAGIELRLEAGAEVHLRSELAERAVEGAVPCLGEDGRYLLLELPRVFPDYLAEEAVQALRGRGIRAVIAHPERCDTLVNRPQILYRLIRAGALGQITGGSLEGTFGAEAKRAARRFLECGLGHILASDAHSAQRRRPVLSRARKLAASIVGEDEARRLVVDRPWAILEGRRIEDLPDAREPEAAGGWFSRWLGR